MLLIYGVALQIFLVSPVNMKTYGMCPQEVKGIKRSEHESTPHRYDNSREIQLDGLGMVHTQRLVLMLPRIMELRETKAPPNQSKLEIVPTPLHVCDLLVHDVLKRPWPDFADISSHLLYQRN